MTYRVYIKVVVSVKVALPGILTWEPAIAQRAGESVASGPSYLCMLALPIPVCRIMRISCHTGVTGPKCCNGRTRMQLQEEGLHSSRHLS